MRLLKPIVASLLVLTTLAVWLSNERTSPTVSTTVSLPVTAALSKAEPTNALLQTMPTALASAALSTAAPMAPLLAANQTVSLPDPGVCPVIADILLGICQQAPGETYCQQ